jgi:penicillin-binding protein 2
MRNPFEIYNASSDSPRRGSSLDWEESALDEDSPVEGFAQVETESRGGPILSWLRFGMLAVGVVLAVKLFSLQVVEGGKFLTLAEGNRLRVQTILAPRGQIVDRTGAVLVRNTASFSLIATPVDLSKDNLDSEIKRLVELLHLDEGEIRDKLKNYSPRSFQPIILKQDLTQEESILFQTHAGEFSGFSVNSIPVREYPSPFAFSHLLGYSGLISETEFNERTGQGYEPNDFIGKSGIELSYEQYLRGVNGAKQVEVDASGRPVKVIGSIEPQPGHVVQLNINQGLQQVLYDAFQKNSTRVKGAAVAMNPKTGEVLALLSLPGYDNNLFAHGISSVDYQKLTTDPLLPLFNRAIAGVFPPGSTVKPVVAAAALQEGVVKENTIINDRGVLVIPHQFDPNQRYNFYGWKRDGLGPMTVRSAIAKSSDIYFYTAVGGHPSSPIDGLGVERLSQYYRKFGAGKTTGIDLQGEKSGLVADPAWKADYFKGDKILSKWYLGDTYHVAIGQGDMLTTPLQVALWTAAVANNGVAYKPTILKRVVDQSGKIIYEPQQEVLVKDVASQEVFKIVQEGMRQTVIDGSATSLNITSVPVAAKTGTSQFDGADPSRTHAWFTSYAPYNDPQLVITVLVEAGGEGYAAAGPIVRAAYDWCAQNNCFKQ